MIPQWLIEKKRDGGELTGDEIAFLIEGYTQGRIPDYQMAALAMAIYFRGMSPAEVSALTRAMLESGDRLDLSGIDRPRIDKHSTGGVGDKVSLILAPLAAECGIAVPMISGRGLGITGGTLDKMESIPGYRADLDVDTFRAVVARCGCSIMGQTPTLAPADRKLYALRDVTGTVPSIPLITASIMSKKLAESLTALVLDVKCGAGAFMKSRRDAAALARSLMAVARAMDLPAAALVTAMDEPLGQAAGNRPEVAESLRALQGHGPPDLMEVTLALAARMLTLGGQAPNEAAAHARLAAAISSGAAFERFLAMVQLHGGDPRPLSDPDRFESDGCALEEVHSPTAGFVTRVDADGIGRAALVLGAGRTKTDDRVDPSAGLSRLVKRGDSIAKRQPLARLHAADPARFAEASRLLRAAITLGDSPPAAAGPLILETLS